MQEEEAEAAQVAERAHAREAEFEDAVASHNIRIEALGSDRHHRTYFELRHCRDVIWVDSADGSKAGMLHTRAQFEALLPRLLSQGPREKELSAVLAPRREEFCARLHETAHPQVATGFRLQDMPPAPAPPPPEHLPPPPSAAAFTHTAASAGAAANGAASPDGADLPQEQLERQAESASIQRGLSYLERLCDALIATETGVQECSTLKAQMADVHGFDAFVAVRIQGLHCTVLFTLP